ncbi:hypothetical protein DFH08DRAFT_803871 [Mycena albidolilacea]|uniref:SAM domain-containing protein n=1 Tax=Mycena albidolilacea TaxID=1033008 RepID=A0AAD7ADS6_9AGAR|nr:hypothetical protein DFH08DRAFT_803871 [Mycena albidolilacea]
MAEQAPETEPQEHKAKVTAQLLFHIPVTVQGSATGAKSKPKQKEKKETKTKEFPHTFQATVENYHELLKTILVKHGEEKYSTDKMSYGMKVQLAGVKKGDSIDVDNWSEYESLAKDIIETLPSKMNIYVDMADVQKRWNKHGNRSDDDDEDADLFDSNGLSDLEKELARLRGKLEKKYQNDHDAGYTYIDSETGESYPLTPQMIKEWCHAMYDGDATASKAPSFITGFDPVKRQVALHPSRIAAGANRRGHAEPGSGIGEVVGHLATIVTALAGGPAAALPTHSAVPSTPKGARLEPAAQSPPIPSPTKLTRFLQHAETKLGVMNALSFEPMMLRNGYGPDIMHLIEDKDLMEQCGMTKGDALRLKAGATGWWKGPDAKRKRSDSDSLPITATSASTSVSQASGSSVIEPATPPSKKVSFEHRFEEGGGTRFWGPRITPVSSPTAYDKAIWMLAAGSWIPVPLGYRAVHDFEHLDDEMDQADQAREEAAAALCSLGRGG